MKKIIRRFLGRLRFKYKNTKIKKMIFITGMGHSGTSILRKIIGNHHGVFDVLNEADHLYGTTIPSKYEFVVYKFPRKDFSFLDDSHQADSRFISVSIIRDPRDVFCSHRKRGGGSCDAPALIEEWIRHTETALNLEKQSYGYLTQYEKLFENNYEGVKMIFDWIGLDSAQECIEVNAQRKVSINTKTIPDREPVRFENNVLFRSWQINQPVKQMSGAWRNELDTATQKIFDKDRRLCELMARFNYI